MSDTDRLVTVILWRGQYRADGLEVLNRLHDVPALPGLDNNLRLEGDAGRWFVVADAVRYQP